jgi:sulfur carrier protein ThiS
VQFEQVLQGEMPEDDHDEPIEQVTELLVFVELPQTVSAVAVQFDITILFAPVQFEQVLQGEMPEDDHDEPIEQVTELLVFVELPQTVSAVAVQFDITILFAPVQFEQVLQGATPEDDHVEPIEQDGDTHDEFMVLPEGDTRPAGHEEHTDGSVKVFDVAPERAKVFAGHVKFPVQVDTVRPAVEP